jgi:tRNA nucleotidyltransferase/poly(A) polymerase
MTVAAGTDSSLLALPDLPACRAAVGVVATLDAAGFHAYLVGGCVRDLLLGVAPKDFDVATAATPQQVSALFSHVIAVGVAFGVVRVRVEEAGHWFELEVATFRADGEYQDGRRPLDVRFTDAREDVLRRDFTINGLLCLPVRRQGQWYGLIEDFVGGKDDLRAGLVRAIGQPAARFAEDALRLLRAVRFAARLDFAIEPATATAIAAAAPTLAKVSVERITQELVALLQDRHAGRGLHLLANVGLGAVLWPDLLAADPGLQQAAALLAALHRQPVPHPSPAIALAVHALVASTPLADQWLSSAECQRTLRLANQERSALQQLPVLLASARQLGPRLWPQPGAAADALLWLRQPAAGMALRLLAALDVSGPCPPTMGLKWLDLLEIRRSLPPAVFRPVLHVTGDTLQMWGHKPGPAFRAALAAAERVQLDGGDADAAATAAHQALAAYKSASN